MSWDLLINYIIASYFLVPLILGIICGLEDKKVEKNTWVFVALVFAPLCFPLIIGLWIGDIVKRFRKKW